MTSVFSLLTKIYKYLIIIKSVGGEHLEIIERLVCQNALQLLVNKNDPALFENPDTFEKNLIGNGASQSAELSALKQSLIFRLPWEVRKHGSSLTNAVVSEMSNSFSAKSKVNLELATWVVNTWIAVLNLKKIDDKPAETPISKAVNTITDKVKSLTSTPSPTSKSPVPVTNATKPIVNPISGQGIEPVAFDKIKGRFGIVFGEDSSGDVKVFNTWYNQVSDDESASMAVTPVKLEVAPVKPFKTAPKKKKESFSRNKSNSEVKKSEDKKNTSASAPILSKETDSSSTNIVNKQAEYKPTAMEQQAYNLLSKGAVFANQALKILAPIAVGGSVFACRKMGEVYYKGYGVMQNFEAAHAWLKLSAAKEDAESLFLMGTMYQLGLGVQKDIPTAKQYFERAAKQGHSKAAESLKMLNVGF